MTKLVHRPVFGAIAFWLMVGPAAWGQVTWYVDDDNCPGPGSGSQGDPFCSIQAGIDAAVDGDTVEVAPGAYVENISFDGKGIAVVGRDGPAVTTIDGGQADSVVSFTGTETADSVLEGFTISNGQAQMGGGIHFAAFGDASPTLRNLVVTGNTAETGAGLLIWGSPELIDVEVSDNHANFSAGGMYVYRSPTLRRVTVSGNTSGLGSGGGIVLDGFGNAKLVTVIVRDNQTEGCCGGGIQVSNSTPTLKNVTVVGNATGSYVNAFGGGIYVEGDAGLSLRNCILWGNQSTNGPQLALRVADSICPDVDVAYCDAQGGLDEVYVSAACMLNWLVGNIEADPQFADPNGGDHHLQDDSPCIETGNPGAAFPPDDTDVDGEPRIQAMYVDMGADEYAWDCNNNGTPDYQDLIDDPSLDENGNGIPDSCEDRCSHPLLGLPRFDRDSDGDVDLADFFDFQVCFTGPGVPPSPDCECHDGDSDGDVDLQDFFNFQTSFTGPAG